MKGTSLAHKQGPGDCANTCVCAPWTPEVARGGPERLCAAQQRQGWRGAGPCLGNAGLLFKRQPAAQSLRTHVPGDKLKCQPNKHRIPVSGAASHQVEKLGESWKVLPHVPIPTGHTGSSGAWVTGGRCRGCHGEGLGAAALGRASRSPPAPAGPGPRRSLCAPREVLGPPAPGVSDLPAQRPGLTSVSIVPVTCPLECTRACGSG